MKKKDMVNKPPHYTKHPSGIECKEIGSFFPHTIACAIKYVWRFEDKKNPVEDLEKALWYIYETLDNMPVEFLSAQLFHTNIHVSPDLFEKYFENEENKQRKEFMEFIYEAMVSHDVNVLHGCIPPIKQLIRKAKK